MMVPKCIAMPVRHTNSGVWMRGGKRDLDEVLGSSESPAKSKVLWKSCPKMASLVMGNIRHYFDVIHLAWSALEVLHHNSLGSLVSL